jgi:nucleotide-binding universal stress UspA family protein
VQSLIRFAVAYGKSASSFVVSADAPGTPRTQIGGKEADMKTILIATDGSDPASAAVAAGLELAADESAEVVFVHVISILDLSPTTNGGNEPQRVPRAEDDPVLSAALDRARTARLAARTELLLGYAPKQILRVAREIDADLIVVGSRGLGRMKSAVLGSTSHEVLANSDRPVLVVRDAGVPEAVNA